MVKDSAMPLPSTPGLLAVVIAALTSGGGSSYLVYLAGRRRQTRIDALNQEKQSAELALAKAKQELDTVKLAQDTALANRTGDREDMRFALDAMKETLGAHQHMIEQNASQIKSLEQRVHDLEKEKTDLLAQLHAVELLKSSESQRADKLQQQLSRVECELTEAQMKLRQEKEKDTL